VAATVTAGQKHWCCVSHHGIDGTTTLSNVKRLSRVDSATIKRYRSIYMYQAYQQLHTPMISDRLFNAGVIDSGYKATNRVCMQPRYV
jgi:hypothetical protein